MSDQRQSLKEIMKRALEFEHVVISKERLEHFKYIEAKYLLEREQSNVDKRL